MVTELISMKQLLAEVEDMLSTCYEGEVINLGDCVGLKLPNGQCFRIEIQEE